MPTLKEVTFPWRKRIHKRKLKGRGQEVWDEILDGILERNEDVGSSHFLLKMEIQGGNSHS